MKDVRRIRSIYTPRPNRSVIVRDLRNLRDRSRPYGSSLENKPPQARAAPATIASSTEFRASKQASSDRKADFLPRTPKRI